MDRYLEKKLDKFVKDANNLKNLYTAGPASLLEANFEAIQPCFGRKDKIYENIEAIVIEYLKKLSGHRNIVRLQGSGSLAIEIGLANFCYGKILIIDTGYYAQRMKNILKNYERQNKIEIHVKTYDEIFDIKENSFDWIVSCYTETSIGFKIDINKIKNLANTFGAKLFIDGTASIGLEKNHNLADVLCYSSCKGLFGFTGASFIAFNENNKLKNQVSYYMNIDTHISKSITGPYHTILSLYGVLKNHENYKKRVEKWWIYFLKIFKDHTIYKKINQPMLCTLLNCEVDYLKDNPVIYSPRGTSKGSLICHIGQVHRDLNEIDETLVKSHFRLKS